MSAAALALSVTAGGSGTSDADVDRLGHLPRIKPEIDSVEPPRFLFGQAEHLQVPVRRSLPGSSFSWVLAVR
jgi:hypothetical protein